MASETKSPPKDLCAAIIGHGSWATAIVKILLENCHAHDYRVVWYVRNSEVREHLRSHHTNPRYLGQVHFDTPRLTVTGDINEAVRHAQVVILATPSAFIADTLAPLTETLNGRFIVSAIKGIVPDGYLTVAEWLNQRHGISFERIGILTGPCHAEEVALERLSYLTMVCKNEEVARFLATKFTTEYTRVSTSTDIYGAEYAAVLKNIYAIAVGICHALGYGDNFAALLICNAAKEMERFLNETFGFPRDICDSAYLGDLLVTCYSQFSRNRNFGVMVGKGYSVKAAQIEMNMIAEGYYSTGCIHHMREKFSVDMPITEAMYRILYEKGSPGTEIRKILDKLK